MYNDHITRNLVDPVKYTYNQGVVIGAMRSLNSVDPAKYPLSDAVELATTSMAYYKHQRKNGYGNPAFDSIFAENLSALAATYSNKTFTWEVQSSIQDMIRHSPGNPQSLLNQGGLANLNVISGLPSNAYSGLFYAPSP